MKPQKSFRNPPKIAEWALKHIYPDKGQFTSLGDFREEYNDIATESGISRAILWYWMQVLNSTPHFLKNKVYWSFVMFNNYIKTAYRNLAKQRIYSIINIFGLSVGLAGATLIFLFVQNELSYDRFHENGENLYRVYTIHHAEDGSIRNRSRLVTLPMGPAMEEYFPEITYSIRVNAKSATVKTNGKLFNERVTLVDKPFFQAFSFPLIAGNPSSVFAQAKSIVLTEGHARKYFGSADPVGKTLTLISGQNQSDFIVTGVAKQPPQNSTITFDILIDMESAGSLNMDRGWRDNWGAFGWQNYVLVLNSNSADSILERYPSFTKLYYGPLLEKARKKNEWKGKGLPLSFGLQEITRVHLDQRVKGSPDLSSILILSAIAFIVLLVACINFTNLAISRASTRSLEVGMRKVLGAERRQLIRQFWGESLMTAGIAMLAGIFLVGAALPTFNNLAGKNLKLEGLLQPISILALLALIAIVGIASGSYPALVISAFRPVEIFKHKLRIGGKNPMTRALVVVQFALSVFLIISTIIMAQQINFLLNRDPGFNNEGIVGIATQEPNAKASNHILKLFRERLGQQQNIISITGTSIPFGDAAMFPFKKDDRTIDAYQNRVDYDFFKTLGIEVVQGRAFSPEFPTDINGVVVNEKLVKELEIDDPIGKPLKGFYMPLTVIGVVRDYNIEDFRHGIAPALHHIKPAWNIAYIYVRISPTNISETLALMEEAWKSIQPNKPFLYGFLDEAMEAMYNEEKRWRAIVGYSSALAILIACMGIFGLTSIAVDRKTKEIGIRKVLGASESQIVYMMIKEFILLVGIANIIAWPLAYYAMRALLDNYYYRISLGPQYFFLAGILSFIIAGLTTIFLAAKAAVSNPAESLRYE
jgi:putative ABC transport system permease protein